MGHVKRHPTHGSAPCDNINDNDNNKNNIIIFKSAGSDNNADHTPPQPVGCESSGTAESCVHSSDEAQQIHNGGTNHVNIHGITSLAGH